MKILPVAKLILWEVGGGGWKVYQSSSGFVVYGTVELTFIQQFCRFYGGRALVKSHIWVAHPLRSGVFKHGGYSGDVSRKKYLYPFFGCRGDGCSASL
jgi:hypothetical protein